jgi:hypothetical protein
VLRPLVGRPVSTGLDRPSAEKRPPHRRSHHQPADKITSARLLARLRHPHVVRYGSLLLALSITCIFLTSFAISLAHSQSPAATTYSLGCAVGADGCSSSGATTTTGPAHGVDSGTPAPTPPSCDQLCAHIQRTYPDPRTQALLLPLAQTPTGRGALMYLLTMGARLGPDFITWRDLSVDGNAGENNAGGYIQLNTGALMRRDLGPYFLSGTLVHEAVESYFDIGEGIRDMGARHADYVAQWFNGKFERELHALPFYNAQDPFYLPSDDSSYGLSYDVWLYGTADGRLYLGSPENSDLRHVDRRGRAWPASDWIAEQGGLWVLGQGHDVTPIPNPLALSPAMLLTHDLRVLA